MTKQHFIAVAHEICTDLAAAYAIAQGYSEPRRTEYYREAKNRAYYAAGVFISVAQSFNPRFDRTRFLKACNLD